VALRPALVWLHRWTGLAMAAFLVVEGLTGSVLAFKDSLEAWVTPELFAAHRPGASPLRLSELAAHAEALAPHARVAYFWVQERRAIMRMVPRVNPSTGAPYALSFDRLFLDPWTGRELGRRREGDLSQGRINLIPFIRRLHTDLATAQPGALILGIVALAWTIDCFVGFWLSLPITRSRALSRWKIAWLVRLKARPVRINFDLHRASGLWLWPLWLVFAWSSVMFNLPSVYQPVTRALLGYRSDLDLPRSLHLRSNASPELSWDAAEQMGTGRIAGEAKRHGLVVRRPYGMAYIEEWGVYTYTVLSTEDLQSEGWNTSIWIDGDSGAPLHVELPQEARGGNAVEAWLRALHFADLRGSSLYRWLVVVLGLVTVALSATGIYIWLCKWRARHSSVHQESNMRAVT